MTLPEFNKRGTLDKGIHQCTSDEFFSKFCKGNSKVRSNYKEILEQLFAFCLSRGGRSIIVGGSFISSQEAPNDLDCIVILPNDKCCTIQSNEFLSAEGCELDIIVLAESSKKSIYSLLNLFSQDKYNLDVGMVEIVLDEQSDGSTWSDYKDYYSLEKLFEAREAYINRHVIRGVKKSKVFVTILNSNDYLLFNYDISPLLSAAGWTFAPYIYCEKTIASDYNNFKNWLTNIYLLYETDISVFADGLGTLLLGQYLMEDSKYIKATFDRIVLSKALLTSKFDWDSQIENRKVNLIINLKTHNVANLDLEKKPKEIKISSNFGDAFKSGFEYSNEKLIEMDYDYCHKIDFVKFQNTIFPLYHMSSFIQENISNVGRDNFEELMSKPLGIKEVIFNQK